MEYASILRLPALSSTETGVVMVKESTSHILIVEDDAKVRLLLRRCFEGEGYRVTEAASGTEAVKLLG